VRPGDTVTLTFELASPEAVELDLEASTAGGWIASVEPASVALEPDAVAAVTVTVEVPDDAVAFASERLTLRVGGVDPVVETTTQLNVLEVVDLRIEAPAQAPIGIGGLRGFVVNAGNSARDVVLELRLADEVLASQASSLTARDRVEFRFDLADEGDHTLVLRSAGAANVERTVRALRFGSPEPEPFVLAGDLTGSVGLEGDWETTLTLRGRLSDFSSLNVLASAPNWRRSYVDLTLEHATVRVGAGGAAPFRLDLPKDLGLAATYERDGFGVGGMVAATSSDQLSAYAAASYAAPTYSVAAGGGVRAGSPVAAVAGGYTADGLVMALSGKYQDEKLGVKLTATIREEQTTTSLRVEARDFLSDRSRLDFEVRLRTGPTGVYGNVTAPLGERASWAWRTGLTHDLTVDLPGNLQLALQAGDSESFARASHRDHPRRRVAHDQRARRALRRQGLRPHARQRLVVPRRRRPQPLHPAHVLPGDRRHRRPVPSQAAGGRGPRQPRARRQLERDEPDAGGERWRWGSSRARGRSTSTAPRATPTRGRRTPGRTSWARRCRTRSTCPCRTRSSRAPAGVASAR
jgi:hypothetical protein